MNIIEYTKEDLRDYTISKLEYDIVMQNWRTPAYTQQSHDEIFNSSGGNIFYIASGLSESNESVTLYLWNSRNTPNKIGYVVSSDNLDLQQSVVEPYFQQGFEFEDFIPMLLL